MACSKEYINKDLAECGICLTVMEEPKALPCLHTFCLKCLSKWAEGRSGVVKCPMCVQDFEIPSEGVTGFVTNFFINTLKDRREIADKLHAKDARIPCSCCVATDCKAEAYCTVCNGFICEECGNTHKRVRSMQNHKTIPFDDLQSGRVDIKTLMKQECCKEHKGQVLRFYCNTCGVLICHECSIVDHPITNHVLVNLKTASKDQRFEIRQLMTECRQRTDSVVNYLENVEKVQNNLEINLKKAKADLHQVAEATRVKVLADIQQRETELEAKLSQTVAENKKQLDAQKDNLQLQQTRLHSALHMASELTETGSEYDLALVYSSLKNSLTQLKDLKPKGVDGNLGDIKFIPNQFRFPAMSSLDSLSLGRDLGQASPLTQVKGAPADMPSSESLSLSSEQTNVHPMAKIKKKKDGVKVWQIEMQFGKGRLKNGRGVALTPAGDVIVTANYGNAYAYSQTGDLKFRINTKQGLKSRESSIPWNVVTSQDGRIFITHQVSHVNVYDTNGEFKYKFPTKSPKNVSSDAHDSRLRGLARDNQGDILIGESNQKYISKNSQDGSHISSFNVTIQPCYIAVTPHNHIVVSSWYNGCVQILDITGNILHTLNPPTGMSSWHPYGICCPSDKDIYIANCEDANNRGGIYCYSVSGRYKECITKEVDCPSDLVLSNDEDKLIVVEQNSVKIFSKHISFALITIGPIKSYHNP